VPLISSPESVRCGRPSLLAMVETIAASSLSLWFAWKHHSFEHIVIAGALAPFLLLRTPISTRYTIRVITRVYIHIQQHNQALMLILLPILSIINILCVIRCVARKPLQSIGNIPINFYTHNFVIDMFRSPKVITGSDSIYLPRIRLNEYSPYTFINNLNGYSMMGKLAMATFMRWKEDVTWSLTIVATIIVLFISVIAYLPLIIIAISFRVAIKSTALLWCPLLWIIGRSGVLTCWKRNSGASIHWTPSNGLAPRGKRPCAIFTAADGGND
jgi:hypothetical protein